MDPDNFNNTAADSDKDIDLPDSINEIESALRYAFCEEKADLAPIVTKIQEILKEDCPTINEFIFQSQIPKLLIDLVYQLTDDFDRIALIFQITSMFIPISKDMATYLLDAQLLPFFDEMISHEYDPISKNSLFTFTLLLKRASSIYIEFDILTCIDHLYQVLPFYPSCVSRAAFYLTRLIDLDTHIKALIFLETELIKAHANPKYIIKFASFVAPSYPTHLAQDILPFIMAVTINLIDGKDKDSSLTKHILITLTHTIEYTQGEPIARVVTKLIELTYMYEKQHAVRLANILIDQGNEFILSQLMKGDLLVWLMDNWDQFNYELLKELLLLLYKLILNYKDDIGSTLLENDFFEIFGFCLLEDDEYKEAYMTIAVKCYQHDPELFVEVITKTKTFEEFLENVGMYHGLDGFMERNQ